MTRILALAAVLLLAACNRTSPPAGSPDDKSAQGESVRRAVDTVDAATAEASEPAAPVVPAAAPAAAKP